MCVYTQGGRAAGQVRGRSSITGRFSAPPALYIHTMAHSIVTINRLRDDLAL